MKEEKNLITERILGIVKIGIANSKRGEIFSGKILEPVLNGSSYKIVVDKWYHNYFHKKKIQMIKWNRKRKGMCTCDCHITPGFYHCWDGGCCDKEGQIF